MNEQPVGYLVLSTGIRSASPRVKLNGRPMALIRLFNNGVTCALILSGISDVDDFMNPCCAGTFKQATVAGIWWSCRGSRQKIGFEVSPIVVPVLGVNLHGLDVEFSWRVYELGHSLWISMEGLPVIEIFMFSC